MQNLAPDLAFSTAAWIDALGNNAIASGGQADSAAVAPGLASAGWLCVCEVDVARATSAAAAVSSIGVSYPPTSMILVASATSNMPMKLLILFDRKCRRNGS